MSAEEQVEYDACVRDAVEKHNWRPYAERYLPILDWRGQLVQYRANFLQRKAAYDRYYGQRRVKRLKSRGQGSTDSAIRPAIVNMLCRPAWIVGVGAPTTEDAKDIVVKNKITPMLDNCHPLVLKNVKAIESLDDEIRVHHHGGLPSSYMFLRGLRTQAFGTGITYNEVVLTEAGLIDPAGWQSWRRILPRVPQDGLATEEGTGERMGDEWSKEYFRTGDGWTRQFFAWHEDEQSRMTAEQAAAQWPAIAHIQGEFALSAAERVLAEQKGVTRDQFRFYRWAETQHGPDIHKFYPATPQEAFLSGNVITFPAQALDAMYQQAPAPLTPEPGERVRWAEMGWTGAALEAAPGLRVYRRPEAGHRYIVGVDSSAGLQGGDRMCIQVANATTRRQDAVLYGPYRPDQTAQYGKHLQGWYNGAFILPERNGLGVGTCHALEHTLRCDNLFRHKPDSPAGYDMTSARKMALMQALSKALTAGNFIVCDRATITEMTQMQMAPGGKFEAPRGMRDDLAVALMLAFEPLMEGTESPPIALGRPRAKVLEFGAV